MSNRTMYRYKIVWKKNAYTGFLNSHKMPLRTHEDILIFYKKLPTYNPQFSEGEPYTKTCKVFSSNYRMIKQTIQTRINEGKRYPLDVVEYKIPNAGGAGDKSHPTQKPVDLLEYLIRTYTNEGELVLDNCMGSGSTAVACVNTGRNFIGYETDAGYCEIARQRVAEAQSEKAVFF